MNVFIKREQAVAPVTDFYLDTIAQALGQAGHSVAASYTWEGLRACELAVIIAATRAPKLWAAGKPYLYWAQGIWPEESRIRGAGYPKYLLQSALERLALKKATYVFFVSEAMRRHYEEKYRLSFEGRCYIMPCANEQPHREAFFTPGKYDQNVFCYAGGLAQWQCFEQTIALYARLEQALPNTKLLLLVKDREQALAMLQKYGVRNYTVDYVSTDALAQVLSGVKYGFLLRQSDPVNTVATPTKLVTYLASGVIPVYSDCLESVEQLLSGCRHKVRLAASKTDEALDRILAAADQPTDPREVYEDFETIFRRHYDRQKHIAAILEELRTKLE